MAVFLGVLTEAVAAGQSWATVETWSLVNELLQACVSLSMCSVLLQNIDSLVSQCGETSRCGDTCIVACKAGYSGGYFARVCARVCCVREASAADNYPQIMQEQPCNIDVERKAHGTWTLQYSAIYFPPR